jgi:hypothetical protein
MIITNIRDFSKIEQKENIKKVDQNLITVTSVYDVWDGPLSGECLYNKEKYIYYCFDQLNDHGDDLWPRKYLLIEDTRKNSNIEKIKLENSQIVGWFDSGTNELDNNNFLKSYFEIK